MLEDKKDSLKEKLIQVFKYFIQVCEQYNLKYYCSGGTAIGAVRHHGMIPWDDDIDVVMPRKDYEKLLMLRDSLIKDGYDISCVKNDKAASLTKFYDVNSTLWELKQIPFVCGVYVDIFPLDEVDYSPRTFIKEYEYFRNICRLYQLSRMECSIKDICCFIKHGEKKLAIKGLASLFIPSLVAPLFRKKILAFEDGHKESGGDHYASFYGDYYEKEYIPKEWFAEGIEMSFEDFFVTLPKEWDKYLSMVFGSYMQLPPIEKRITHHYHYYLNLDEGLTLDKIESQLKE